MSHKVPQRPDHRGDFHLMLGLNPDDASRQLPERWVIQVCPRCNGLVGELSQTHLGDCEYRNKLFASRSVEVVPAPK